MTPRKPVRDWKSLFEHAKARSPFYRELYQGISHPERIQELPVVDQSAFWKANVWGAANRVLTTPNVPDDGIVFQSGGTTGSPKISVFTRGEWDAFTDWFGWGMGRIGLLGPGDRVANLFYVGELYASFLFITRSLEKLPFPTVQFPIAGATDPELALTLLNDFDVTVWAGVPTTLLELAHLYSKNPSRYPKLRPRLFLFGGESMHEDQRRFLTQRFPGSDARSIGWASVDGGLLGYADRGCLPNEHRVFSDATVLEIVDELTLQPILEPETPGRVLLTSLTRDLMPIIRYPAGDVAVWVEPGSRLRIVGRSEEGARVGPVTVYYDDMRRVLDRSLGGKREVESFQLVLSHREGLDLLTWRIAALPEPTAAEIPVLNQELVRTLYAERPLYEKSVHSTKIHPIAIEWVAPGGLWTNPRTGKLKRVIDTRFH